MLFQAVSADLFEHVFAVPLDYLVFHYTDTPQICEVLAMLITLRGQTSKPVVIPNSIFNRQVSQFELLPHKAMKLSSTHQTHQSNRELNRVAYT